MYYDLSLRLGSLNVGLLLPSSGSSDRYTVLYTVVTSLGFLFSMSQKKKKKGYNLSAVSTWSLLTNK